MYDIGCLALCKSSFRETKFSRNEFFAFDPSSPPYPGATLLEEGVTPLLDPLTSIRLGPGPHREGVPVFPTVL
jgi:hypothetical protein